jgi:hypothetical protein
VIRDTTPTPRRPACEADLLDIMLTLLKRKPPMESESLGKLVKLECERLGLPVPSAFDIRSMLRPPYFVLRDAGWECLWRL